MKKTVSILLVFIMVFSLSISAFASSDYNIEKNVTGGRVRGHLVENGEVAEYKGIPYAAPPIGENRWRDPQPVENWDGVNECTEFSASAMQTEQFATDEYTEEFIIDTSKGYSEDCLYLNVWTKADNSCNKPVIVYIHGGGFLAGGASCEVYTGKDIAKKDVVFVSINYRLGIFGFFANEELNEESPLGVSGNYAILDMIAALEWVKNNISQFGGNPENVTIMGQSAGACATELLTISPLAKGLFNKAVILSYPQTGNTYASLKNRETYSRLMTKGKSIEELRKMDAQTVLDDYGSLIWFPCIDGKIIPCSTIEAYKQGIQNDVDVITNVVDEGDSLFGIGFGLLDGVISAFSPNVKFTSKIMYLPKMLVSLIKNYSVKKLGDFTYDRLYASQYFLAKARSVNGTGKTYISHFSYIMPGGIDKGFHTSDVPYWLNHLSDNRKDAWTETDVKVADTMSSYLVNFAETGNPNGDNLPIWNEYSGAFEMQVFASDGAITKESCFAPDFWNLYAKLNYGI